MQNRNIIAAIVLLIFLMLFATRLYFWCLHPLLLWADQAVYLEMAQLLLSGMMPYRDFFDFNPPLIIYLSVLPILLSKLVHIPATFAFTLTINATLFCVSTVMLYMAYKARESFPLLSSLPMLAGFMLFNQSLLTDIGQREHIFVLLDFPYFLLRAFKYMGAKVDRRLPLLIGALAGLGLALKPQFLLLALAAELALFLSFKKSDLLKSAEFRALLAVLAIYLLHFVIYSGSALSVIVDQVIPTYLGGFEWFADPLHKLVAADSPDFYFSFLFILTTLLVALPLRDKPLVFPLYALTIGATVIYLAGGSAWSYRLLPALCACYMLLGLLVGALAERFNRYSSALLELSLVFSAFLLTLGYCLHSLALYKEESNGPLFSLSELGYTGTNPRGELSLVLFTILKQSASDDRVLFVGTGILPGYPAILQSGRKPASRYLYGMVLPMLKTCADRQGGKFKETLLHVVDNLGEDILKNRPALIFIQKMPVAALLSEYDFARRYLLGYENIGEVEDCFVYKYNGALSYPREFDATARRRAVISLLAGKSLKEVAKETGVAEAKLAQWLKQASDSLDKSVSDNPEDESSVLQENKALKAKLIKLEDDNALLRKQVLPQSK